MSDFPSSKFERGKIFAKTGLKVGTNYAKHYLDSSLGKKPDKQLLHKKTAGEVFGEFTRLRGTALKIAQSMSMDQGFLPDEFAEVMTQAQYKVPPINKALVRSIIKQELGKYPEMIFESFSADAIAAASIGQVHKATLKDGRTVAVKIQYPGVRDTISSDLSLAKTIFRQLVKKGSDIDGYFDEIRETLLLETDYIHEGEQIEKFHQRFSGDEVVTPRWIRELSSERVLTMTFIEGKHLNEFLEESPAQEMKDHFGQLLWNFFHNQIKNNEEIHADTHPGNFLFMPDNKLGVIDFGCVKKFPEEFFYNYLKLLPLHLKQDEKAIAGLYKKLKILKSDPFEDKKERQYFNFCKKYGYTFAMPYRSTCFDFGNPEYISKLKSFTRDAPVGNEPRGSRHFIYSTRVHLGLYHLLMKLKARISTEESIHIVDEVLGKHAGLPAS